MARLPRAFAYTLRLLAVPEEEREDFAREVDAEHMSARDLEEAIRERDEARKHLETADRELGEAQKALRDTEAELAETKDALEDQRVKREDAGKSAGAAAEKSRAEAEELRKRLVAAQSGANEVILLVKLAQENFNLAVEKLHVMKSTDGETADKLLAGMKKILETLIGRCG